MVDTQAGQARCLAQMSATVQQLEAAFDSTAGAVASWRRQQLPGEISEPWSNYSATMVVTVCYVHGGFGASFTGIPYNRAVVIVGSNGYVDGRGPLGSSDSTAKGYLPLVRP